MHYYTHNIGEFAAKTRFMSPEEIGIYVILKDEYMLSGMRLACDRIATLMPPECDGSLTRVLKRFFVEEDGVYVCREFDEELGNFKDRGSINAQNAKKRWEKRKQASDSDANVCEPHATCTDSHANECLTNNQEPITNNQKPKNNNQEEGKGPAAKRRASPKTAIPFNFGSAIPDDFAKYAAEKFPEIDADEEFAKFIDYHEREGSKFSSWIAAWRTWLANARKFSAERPERKPAAPARRPTDPQAGWVSTQTPINPPPLFTPEEREAMKKKLQAQTAMFAKTDKNL